ncbi:uncharacterized protein [Spinacia oleracea]|uniref:Uncharacterized protein n=1 Tax=Spinacia oleracea TaxID=3562 RepID=A0ABM3RPZ7_SPIOL|nr:uncharacterized protein LOC110798496 [Spinacia oleracea]
MEKGDEYAIDSANNCENTSKEDHIQYAKNDNAVVSELHTNATEENISKTEKTEKDVAKTTKTVTFGSPTVNEEISKNIVLECDIIRNEDIEEDNRNPERIDGEQEPILQTTSTESTISIQKSVPETEYNRVPQPKERIKHTLIFTTEGVQTTSEVIPIKRGQPPKKVIFKIKGDLHGLKALPTLVYDQRNESEKLDISTENKESEKLEENTKEPQKKENKDEKSHTKEQGEVLVETDNEEIDDEQDDDDDHKEQNENIESKKPRSAPGWENVKKSTCCPMEKKDSGEEEDNAEGDENEETGDDEDENNKIDEDENAENKSENLKSPSRQKVK